MAFILRADTNAAIENGSVSGNVLQNDSEAVRVTQVRAGAGTYVPVTSGDAIVRGLYGTLSIRADGSYVYAADLADRMKQGATNTDTFTYDSTGTGSGSTTLRIALTGINDAPVLTSTTVTLPRITEDQTNNDGRKISVFLASTDVDSNLRGIAITGLDSGNGQWQYSIDGRASWSAVGTVSEGSALVLRGADYIRFVPNGVSGTTADFAFRAWDQTSGVAGTKANASITGGETAFSTATGTASILVGSGSGSGNNAPVGVSSTASGSEDGPPITGRVQATDSDSSTLTYALVASSAVGGSASINANTGDYSFTAAKDFNGTASFRFTASDGSLTSSPTPVTIAIAAVNDAPVAAADSGSTNQGTPVLLNVLANDTDVDGDALTIAAVGGAANGTVQILNGQVRYAPNSGFTGNDSFAYTVSDGAGGTAQASAAVSVGSASPSSAAVSVTFRQGTNGYAGAVDTVLKENKAALSFGDAVVLRSALDGAKDSDALLRFDGLFGTGPGQIPVGAQIVSATLQLQVTGASAAGGTFNRMLVGWTESSTWNSLGSGVQTDGTEATSAGTTIGAVALGPRVFNVTDSLAAWNAAGSTSAQHNATNLGWVFNPTGTDPWEFSSSNGAVKPVLTVTYTVGGAAPAALPTVSISAAAPATESGGRVTFNLSLSQAATQDVTVFFSTADHTAKAGSDYVGMAQSLTFLAGQTTKSFNVSVVNDNVGERLETFSVQINSATNARIDGAVAIGKISDDDVAVPAMPALNPVVVAVHNLANGAKYKDGGTAGFGIGDPSGLAYIPSLGTLFVADSEHDESPYNSPTNLFALGLDGSFLRNHSLLSFTKEPTGIAYNSANGFLYVADDDKGTVSWVAPTNPSARLGFFDTARLGFVDTEDLKFDPVTGNAHILDGVLKQMFEVTAQGQFVNSISLPAVMKDAEALAYDSRHDLYFVGSGASALIWVLDAEGSIKATIDILSSFSPRPELKGMELAPSSNPNDGDALSLYVADYGSDQVNDGKLYEIKLGVDWFT
jgi:VCBS repeat-containing protein